MQDRILDFLILFFQLALAVVTWKVTRNGKGGHVSIEPSGTYNHHRGDHDDLVKLIERVDTLGVEVAELRRLKHRVEVIDSDMSRHNDQIRRLLEGCL